MNISGRSKKGYSSFLLGLGFLIAIMFLPTFFGGLLISSNSSGVAVGYSNSNTLYTTPTINIQHTAFIWFFGYIGNTFYPQTELRLSQNAMINEAKNLSNTFGKSNLVLLTAVDEIPLKGGTVSTSKISAIAKYVSDLKKYASAVYGRLDFFQFNLTKIAGYGNCNPSPTNCPVFNQTALYINKLGLNGVWYDHGASYWGAIGNVTFNKMMQNLTNEFPKATFILNHTPPANKFGIITELKNYTWEKHTWVAPSPPHLSLTPNYNYLQLLGVRFPGHVLMHFDAAGPPALKVEDPEDPMSIFAADSAKIEISALNAIVYNGTHPAPGFENESFAMVIPIIGSWTFDGRINGSANYHGLLYNSLYNGKYPRHTFESFVKIVCNDLQITCS